MPRLPSVRPFARARDGDQVQVAERIALAARKRSQKQHATENLGPRLDPRQGLHELRPDPQRLNVRTAWPVVHAAHGFRNEASADASRLRERARMTPDGARQALDRRMFVTYAEIAEACTPA